MSSALSRPQTLQDLRVELLIAGQDRLALHHVVIVLVDRGDLAGDRSEHLGHRRRMQRAKDQRLC